MLDLRLDHLTTHLSFYIMIRNVTSNENTNDTALFTFC